MTPSSSLHHCHSVFFRADYLHVLTVNSAHLPARVNLAFLLQQEGKFQEAWDNLTIALDIDGMYGPALEARAIINLQMKNFFGAVLDLTKALEVNGHTQMTFDIALRMIDSLVQSCFLAQCFFTKFLLYLFVLCTCRSNNII